MALTAPRMVIAMASMIREKEVAVFGGYALEMSQPIQADMLLRKGGGLCPDMGGGQGALVDADGMKGSAKLTLSG